jgi:glycosyltransferase involved in cell wall biosynthesis
VRINLSVPINQLGYGVVGLNVLKALSEAGHEPALWPEGPVEVPACYHPLLVQTHHTRARPYDPQAPCLRILPAGDLALRIGRGIHAGFPMFELDRFMPCERQYLDQLDRILVTSKWAQDVVRKGTVLSVERTSIVPLAVDRAIFHAQVSPWLPALPGLKPRPDDNRTIFLNVGKWEKRKGHDVLREAFLRAFRRQDNVLLLMNCANPFLRPEETQKWIRHYQDHPLGDKVGIIQDRLASQADLARLMAAADAGVFPARAEGWNLDLAEMMAMGKWVIATNYSAHTEFCNADNSLLISVDRTEPAVDGTAYFHGQGEWSVLGESQIQQLADHLRFIHESKQKGTLQTNQAGIKTFSETFTWAHTAARIVQALS